MMNYSISNIAWSPSQRLKVYRYLKSQQIKFIEIAPKLFLHNEKKIFNLSKFRINNHLNELRRYDLKISSMQSLLFNAKNCYLFGSKKERTNFKKHLIKVIDLASKLGIRNLVFGSPKNRVIPKNMTYKIAEKIAVRTFKTLGVYAKKKKIIISIESNPKIYGTNFLNNIFQTSKFVKKVDSENIKMILDTGEIIVNKNISKIKKIIKKNIKIINHVHLSEPYLKPLNNTKLILNVIKYLYNENYNKFISIEMRKNKNNLFHIKKSILKLKN